MDEIKNILNEALAKLGKGSAMKLVVTNNNSASIQQ